MNKELRNKNIRSLVVVFFLCFLFSTLIMQFFQLQIVDCELWTKRGRRQHEKLVEHPYQRGRFFSNTEILKHHKQDETAFVFDVPKFDLYLDPVALKKCDHETLSRSLSKLLENKVSSKKILAELKKPLRSRKIMIHLSIQEKQRVELFFEAFAKKYRLASNALFFEMQYCRSYPFGHCLGQVLHSVRHQKDPKTGHHIPNAGLEFMFDPLLRGKKGEKVFLRSPRYALEKSKDEIKPIDGADIYLTVNHTLQTICEEELEKGVRKVEAKGGQAIMMCPKTGHVLALAQYPFFDPRRYEEYYNNKDLESCTRIKAHSDCYEIGSIMKPITMAICLMANKECKKKGRQPIFNPDEMIACQKAHFKGRSCPIFDIRRHGFLNMDMALQKSSNVYIAKIIEKVIAEFSQSWYRRILVDLFGFSKKTNIELPAENAGFVPTPGKMYASGQLQWSMPTTYSLSIGYNILVSPLQMLKAFCLFANGGYEVRPTLIKKIVRQGKLLYESKANTMLKKILDQDIINQVLNGMKLATKRGGSAFLADVKGFTQAGKTSTSEKLIAGSYSKDSHLSTFIGFAPAKNAQFVIYVLIDEPCKKNLPGFGSTHFGGKCAAPIFADISKRALEYLGVEFDDPFGFHFQDPRYNKQKADMVNKIEQLELLYKKYNACNT